MKKFLGNNRYLSEWILLLTGLLLVVAVVGLTAYQERQEIGKRERERLADHAEVLNKNLGNALHIVDRALLNIRTDLPQWRKAEGGMLPISDRLRGFAEAMPSVRTMLVLDAAGTTVAASRAELLGQNFAHRDYFTQAHTHPDPDILYVAPPFRNVLGVWTINLVRVISGPKGEFAGIIVAGIDPASLRQQLGALLYHKDMWAAIAHADGLQVVMEPDRPGQDGLNLAQPGSFFSRHMASGQAAQVLAGTASATGEQRLMALRTVRHPDVPMDKPLVIAIGRDMRAMYVPWYRQLRLTGGLLFFLIATTIPALMYIQHRRHSVEALKAQAEAALREKQRFLQDLIEHSGTIIFAKDVQGRYLLINQMYEHLTGLGREQVIGHTDIDIYPCAAAARLIENDKAVMAALQTKRYEEQVGAHYFLTTKFPLFDDAGQVTGVCGISADITEQKQVQKKMEWLANTDMLTGLANRRHFYELASIEISRAKRLGHGLAVLMLDIDHFKSVNDTYGHDVGDQVIAYLGETCRNVLRDIDISGRLGGEEFAVLLPATSLNDAQEVAERLRRRIAEHQMALPENTILQFTVSIGCAHSADATLNIDQLLKVADQHLYQAKKSGRNRVVA